MQLQLRELARQYGVALPSAPPPEPMLPPTDDYSVDAERVRFPRHALLWSRLPPLYYRHQPTVIGAIQELRYSDQGLHISSTTNHREAVCCPAFSVAVTVNRFEIVDASTPNFYALDTSGWIDEISLVPQGVNAGALGLRTRTGGADPRSRHKILSVFRRADQTANEGANQIVASYLGGKLTMGIFATRQSRRRFRRERAAQCGRRPSQKVAHRHACQRRRCRHSGARIMVTQARGSSAAGGSHQIGAGIIWRPCLLRC
jgi:hypothetical protein